MINKSCTIFLHFILLYCALSVSQIDFYKKGLIKLEADPNFGQQTAQSVSLYDTRCDLLRAPNGSLFIAAVTDHCIYIFSPEGKYIGKHGHEGQGPGDLYFPGDLSVLDGRYLVIGEYATSRRVSLFDLEGNFVKLLKTDRNASTTVALRDNKIAYTTYEFGPMKNQVQEFTTIIIIKDVETKKETAIDEFRTQRKFNRSSGGGGFVNVAGSGEMLIAQTKNGNLLVGKTVSNELKIFLPEGKLLQSFTLKMDPVQVTRDYVRRYKEMIIQDMEERGMNPSVIAALKKTPYEDMFGKYLPYFKEILVDSEGNILICKKTDCIEDCSEVFQVYSPEGKYICEFTIDSGIYEVTIDRRFKNIIFANDAVYGLFPLKESQESALQLIRVKLH
jgi:hypothetical protein